MEGKQGASGKAALCYFSHHHGNTKKVAQAIAEECGAVLIDVCKPFEGSLEGYGQIGFASGIYFGRFHDMVLRFAQDHLPPGRAVFLVYTYGIRLPGYERAIRRMLRAKGARVTGRFGCRGYDTYGVLARLGGLAKNRPGEQDLKKARAFGRRVAERRAE